ncbi:hypothetical protein AB0K38_20965 [Streptomyces griseoincarnatus]
MTALLADSVQDIAAIDTALRLAVPRRAPLLLVAVLPAHAHSSVTADTYAARAVTGRVLPRVRPAWTTFPSSTASRRAAPDCGRRGRYWTSPPATCPRCWWPPTGDRPDWTLTS